MVTIKKGDFYKLLFLLFLLAVQYYAVAQLTTTERENKFYALTSIPIPEDVFLEVGGMDFDDQGRLAVCTRRGEVWIVENPAGKNPKYTRYAHGLHEPLGIVFKNDGYYVTQRAELTRLEDRNDDGKADWYETVYSWPLAGNYHEYSYGPHILPNDDMLLTLNLAWIGRGASLAKWRGWIIKVTPDGEMEPIAAGMRSPAGFGANAAGDIFYTENQGGWVGSGRMSHVEKGDFLGNPEGLIWTSEEASPLSLKKEDIVDTLGYTLYDYSKKIPEIKPPSVWFPHTIQGISTSGIIMIDHDEFGPFKDQLLVGDQGHSKIMRVYQEKVNGEYQGVSFGFREGFSSGVLRLEWGPDKSLYVGMTNRGWPSIGQELYGLQRLDWTGKMPFEIRTVKAKPDGFKLEFTQKVDKKVAGNLDSYQVSDFTYKYHHYYGSPVVDLETRRIFDVEVSEDGRSARLFVEGLRPGYIYEIKASGVENVAGDKLLHNVGYYTLNNIPEGPKRISDKPVAKAEAKEGDVLGVQGKRVTKMPSSWNEVDKTLTITAIPGLKFDLTELTVSAGSKVKLVFENPDDMLHNVVIVNPGTADQVAQAAIELGLRGQEMEYVPESENVLFYTKLLQPNTNETIYFEAPEEPGDYQYICSFPGHAVTMRGVLRVVAE